MSKYNKLEGTRVLVLGGSSGIGYAVAEAALESGATVYISSSSPAKVDAALAQLHAHAGVVRREPLAYGRACDLGDPTATERNLTALLDWATDSGTKPLNHVVFTAGDALPQMPLSAATADGILAGFHVRVIGALMLAKLLPRYTARSNKTSYTLTGGSLAARPAPGMALVTGLAAAMEGYARGLAVDLAPMRVNVVQAGAVRTGLLGDDPDMLALFAKDTITGTVGRPEEIAEAYLYLMKDSFITAAVIESSGGRNVAARQEVSEFN
ncbi:short-chain dehydrogenase [Cordyceps militaris]|uniref:Short-chain dehydrogenase n=1 Tax=Cordyceps militaris TaxID=73501 RepID=A0A2H4SNA5_CORMI|nr:short-chain dehydrogenase [Cordyceps militaris]